MKNSRHSNIEPFSLSLERWLNDKKPKTIGSMLSLFDDKSFAFIFFILLLFPALPIPTGGASHVFEVIVILLAIQMIVGREELWLPESFKKRAIPQAIAQKILPYTKSRIQWLERFSRVRGVSIMRTRLFRMQLGLVVTFFSFVAFIAPPFSMLDTLPSLGVVLIALGIILEDIYVVVAGYIIGTIGVALVYLLGMSVVSAFAHLF